MKIIVLACLVLMNFTNAFSCESTTLRENIIKMLEEDNVKYTNLYYNYSSSTRFEESLLGDKEIVTRLVYFRYDFDYGHGVYWPYLGAYEVTESCEMGEGGSRLAL